MKWKTAIHGKGWSSPVIWGAQVWLTTATEDGTELSVLCVDKETGKVLRDEVLFRVATPQFCHKFNSYASPTPVIEEGRVYVTFGSPGTACLDTKTGAKLWERTDFVCNHFRGAGSSPIVWGDLLIMNFDGSDHQFVVALDKKTGKTVWETKRSVDYTDLDKEGKPSGEGDWRKAFATPHVIEQDGQARAAQQRREGALRLRSARPARRCGASTSPRITARRGRWSGFGMVFIAGGIFARAQVFALKLGGQRRARRRTQVAWRHQEGRAEQAVACCSSAICFIMINDGGIANCVEAKTGNVVWSERVGGNCRASPIFADGPHLHLQRGGQSGGARAGAGVQTARGKQISRRLHGVAGGVGEGALSADQDAPLSGRGVSLGAWDLFPSPPVASSCPSSSPSLGWWRCASRGAMANAPGPRRSPGPRCGASRGLTRSCRGRRRGRGAPDCSGSSRDSRSTFAAILPSARQSWALTR